MRICLQGSVTTLNCTEDEAYEIFQALESHKRKLGRLASKCNPDERPAVVQVYNSVENMLAKMSSEAHLVRKSRVYILK